jgi:hypothetical protein
MKIFFKKLSKPYVEYDFLLRVK